MAAARPLSAQIYELMVTLDNLTPELNTPELREKVLAWVKDLPPGARPPELLSRVARIHSITETALADILEPQRKKSDIEDLIPKTGWLHDYIEYTRKTEPPTVYHFFAGAVAIASTLARNVYFRRGDKDIFPNLWVVLVGPSGVVRKTTACNLAINLFRNIGGNVLADKLTPEALIDSFKEKEGNATGLIFAPELAVFLGKQKYQEGMIPMLTALSDNPAKWSSGTIMRGSAELTNVGLTFLAASTLDWIQHAIPREAFGGGFMSRLLFVVQERTPRRFSEPPPLDDKLRIDLIKRLRLMTQIRGEFSRTEEAFKWWDKWYGEVTDRAADNKHFAGYLARIPDQVWRLAMLLVVAEGKGTGNLVVEERHFVQAHSILMWVESYLPGTFDQLAESGVGSEQMKLLKQLKTVGGSEKHSNLLRKNARTMNAENFRRCIDTLRQAGLVEYDQAQKQYYLTPEGWKEAR